MSVQERGIPVVAQELIRAAQKGDRDALITLLREIETDVYRTAYYFLGHEQDAMDAAQEALIKVYTKINSYEEKKALFKTWVQRIVTNLCIDKFRKNKPAVSLDQHDIFAAPRDVEDEIMSSFFWLKI